MDQPQLLAALGGSHLTSYMGKVVPGWEQRPKVRREPNSVRVAKKCKEGQLLPSLIRT
jgi:hypothetical protein